MQPEFRVTINTKEVCSIILTILATSIRIFRDAKVETLECKVRRLDKARNGRDGGGILKKSHSAQVFAIASLLICGPMPHGLVVSPLHFPSCDSIAFSSSSQAPNLRLWCSLGNPSCRADITACASKSNRADKGNHLDPTKRGNDVDMGSWLIYCEPHTTLRQLHFNCLQLRSR